MILAGIVLYNPDEIRLNQNIEAVIKQVDEILLVDNNSSNYERVLKKYSNEAKIKILHNDKNEGIAYALNQILEYANNNSYDYFLTLDQDSICKESIIDNYKKYINLPNMSMITCEIEDRNIKSSKKPQKENVIEIDRCITSGTFNKTKALLEVGGFDNKMFIDYVDFDICQSLKESGYKIYKINFEGLLHEVGKGKLVKILNKEIYVYNHNDLRVYYYVRNAIYYMKKHKLKSNNFKNFIRLNKRITIIILFEKGKFLKLKAILKGIKDGILMKVEVL